MKIKLFPKDSFDSKSIETINKLMDIAKNKLNEIGISLPKEIEFYDDLNLFIKRILPQVKNYGLTENQSKEFIKSSLNSGTYGTFNIDDNSIIEMNFNPYFKTFYPSIHFLKLLIHESLHLFLYSKIERNIYNDKFRFKNGKYIGKEKIIQLDEGFAEFLTEKILENFEFDTIKELPIYSELNKIPKYKKEVEGLNLDKFNDKFDILYKYNSKKGYELIEKKFNKLEGDLKEKIKRLISYVSEEIEKLFEHK